MPPYRGYLMTPAASKRKGANAEIELCRHLIAHGHQAIRMHLTGAHDEGDVLVLHPNGTITLYEVKSVVRLDIPGALRELAREVTNAQRQRPGVTIHGKLAVRLKGGKWAIIQPLTP